MTPPFDIFHWIASSVACSPAAADGTARAVDELPALPPSVLLGTATRAPISADDAVGGAAEERRLEHRGHELDFFRPCPCSWVLGRTMSYYHTSGITDTRHA